MATPPDLTAIRQTIRDHDDSAVDLEDMEIDDPTQAGATIPTTKPDPTYLPGRAHSKAMRVDSVTGLELHPTSTRIRRPSAIRQESATDTLVGIQPPEKILEADEPGTKLPPESPLQIPTISRAPTLVSLNIEEPPQPRTQQQKRQEYIHLAALYWCFFLEGWNDGTLGPLMPVIQRDYHVGFAVVSMIFVTNFLGFVIGATLNVWVNQRFGFGKACLLGATFQLLAYIIQCTKPPFAALTISYFLVGFGLSFQNAQGNGFVGCLPSASTKLMILHASYGLGAFASPLVSTHFAMLQKWERHFLTSVCIAVSNVVVLGVVFRGKRQEALMRENGVDKSDDASANTTANARRSDGNMYGQILGTKAVYILAMFALLYIGIEVTIGGWIVTFIIEKREGGPDAGYISSGFFGGLTLGRLILMWFNKKMGAYISIIVYTLLAIGLELTVWLVPSIIENAIAVSVIGLVLGPMFPLMVTHGQKIIPPSLFTGSMGWITGFGMSGSAMLPLITGVLAAKYGIGSLQPFLIAMMSTMIAMWTLVPRPRRVD